MPSRHIWTEQANNSFIPKKNKYKINFTVQNHVFKKVLNSTYVVLYCYDELSNSNAKNL